MIRKMLIFTVLTLTAAAAIVLPLWKSDAAQQQPSIGSQKVSTGRALPNFDIRLTDRGGFNDIDLNSTSGKQAAMQNARTRSRSSAVEQFRSSLQAEHAKNLRAVVNEAGAMKNFFIDGTTLSEPQSDTADNIARRFLAQHNSLFVLSDAGIDELKLENEDNDRGTTFLNYSQTVGGLKVFEGQVQVVVNKNGEVLNVREGFLVDGPPRRRTGAMSEAKALAKAFEHAGRNVFPSFVENYSRQSKTEMSRFANPLDLNFEEVLSEQVVVRVGGESRLAWHVFAEVGPEEWYEILLDAYTGELLLRHNLYLSEAQGTVYTEAPDKGPRQLVSFVGDTIINTAAGWMGTSTVTTGNNVEAYLDTDANNAPDNNNGAGLSVGHASAANQDFTFPFSTTVDPRTQQAAVVTNLFYFNNVIHDFSYNLGFTETARNFQVDNFGRGGIGNDSVRAEAQDGSGTNNANFATPPDGSRPRMQQYLFTSPNPDRDSSVDGDVVFHEYGHGISNRLIGNGSTALTGIQSGALGEGWSDYWAITINNDGAVGEYVTNNPAGIRRAAYTVPAAAVHDSYDDLQSTIFSTHADGEVWAATLWDLRTQLGAATTDLLVLNGMKFTSNLPSFLDARDGILQADQNGANRCAIWTVFARHGMGVSAVGNDGTTHVAATDIPANCACSFSINPTSASIAAAGESASVTVTTIAGCNWTAASNDSFITITSGASGSGSGTVNYSVAANTVSTPRSGSMTIAGLTFSVSQAGVPTRTLTVASANPGSGVNITVSPNDNSGLGNGATPFNRTYNHNTDVSLLAPATAGGNNFQKWQRNGVDFSFTQSTSVTMDADYTLTAVYVTPTRTLTVASANPNSGVSITVSPNDNSNQGSGATPFNRTYNHNTNVTLTAPATAGGNNFQKWQRNGVDFSFTQSTSVTMDADYTLTAVYVTPTRTLTVASANPNSGVNITVSPNDNSGLGNGATPFNRTYNLNTNVTLTAPATAGGNNFQKWQRNGVDFSTNPSTTVLMDADYTLTAVYVTPTRTLSVASANPGSGVNITASPNDNSGLGNGATPFNRTYNQNTSVTLTAPATAGGNNFQKWQRNGVDFSFTQSTNVTMDADYTLTAVYITPTRTLTVASANPNSGVSITVSPNDNSNQGSGATPFNRTYNLNTTVTLTASATAGGNNFQKWQRNGVDFSTNPSTTVLMDADYTLTAVYVTPTRTLTVASANPNSGVNITVSPNDNSGLGNGATPFNRTYNLNTSVALTAPATAGGNNFQKWQRNGVDFSFTQSTSVTMDANYTLTAVYITPPPTRTLTVGSANPNSGVSITVSPNDNSGLGNGATPFNRTYNLNTNVTLTAPATAGGNNFQKWQRNGVDFSTNPSTTVLMDANYTLTAVYVTPTRTLTVASSNPNSGVSITVSPNDNSNQGSGATPFNRTYNPNTIVTLTAPATAGSNNFQKWQRNGVDFSFTQSTSVTMDANYTLTAVYITPPPTRTLTVGSANPNSGVNITVSPNDNNSQGSGATPLSRIYNLNTTVTLTAPATAGGNIFHKWQRDGVDFSIKPTISLMMTANYTLTAVYGIRTLTISSNPSSGVSITVSPNDNNNQGNGTTGFSRIYNLNTTVTLTAPATAGANIFQKWQRNGVDFSFTQSISVTMDTDYQLMAVYVSPPAPVQTLSVAVQKGPESPSVSITVSPNDNNNQGGGTAPFNRSYNHNTTVTLTAPSSVSLSFRRWQRNGLTWSTNPTTTVTMDSNYTMTAVYGPPVALRTLNVASSNPNSGVSINLFPNDIHNRGSDATQFTRIYNPMATVTLVAPPTAGGNSFQKWQRNGVDFSTNPAIDVTMDLFTVNMTAVYVGGGGSFTLGPSPALANPGGVNINWTSPADHSIADWFGLFRTSAPSNTWIDFQYLLNNSFTSSVTSNNFTVWSDCGNHNLTASPDPGATITVSWITPGNHPIVDLMALVRVGRLTPSRSTSNTFPPAHQDRCFSQHN